MEVSMGNSFKWYVWQVWRNGAVGLLTVNSGDKNIAERFADKVYPNWDSIDLLHETHVCRFQ